MVFISGSVSVCLFTYVLESVYVCAPLCVYICVLAYLYVCLCVCIHVSLSDRWTDRTREQHRLGFCTLVCMCGYFNTELGLSNCQLLACCVSDQHFGMSKCDLLDWIF